MRRAGRTDANETAVVEALRKRGCSVAITSGAGNGLPDLLVGWMGQTLLLELKDGEKVPSAKKLTPAEAHFVANWKGRPVRIIESPEEAINYVLAECRWARTTISPPRTISKFVGRKVSVLWESTSEMGEWGWKMEGWTENYLRVSAFAPSPRWNDVDWVSLEDVEDGRMKGVILNRG